jgi:hypothetical protein
MEKEENQDIKQINNIKTVVKIKYKILSTLKINELYH